MIEIYQKHIRVRNLKLFGFLTLFFNFAVHYITIRLEIEKFIKSDSLYVGKTRLSTDIKSQ